MLDYKSDRAWNDPYNPWPIYNTVTVQFTNNFDTTYNAVLTAMRFQPIKNPGYYGMTYTNTSSSIQLILTPYNQEGNTISTWTLNSNGNFFLASVTARKFTLPPLTEIGQGSSSGWYSVAYTSPVNSIYIGFSGLNTGLSNLLPWELRRRKLLEYR